MRKAPDGFSGKIDVSEEAHHYKENPLCLTNCVFVNFAAPRWKLT